MHQEHLLRSSFITFPSLFSFFLSFFPFFVVKRSRRNDLSQIIIIIIMIVMAMIKKKALNCAHSFDLFRRFEARAQTGSSRGRKCSRR